MSEERFCVYSTEVGDELIKIGRETYEDILRAQKMYPDVAFISVIHMATHRAATIATNAALGKPLDRKYSTSEDEESV